MARFVSSRNVISVRTLKRRAIGSVVVRHYGKVDIRFTRIHGGWSRQSVTSDPVVVSSAAVAAECNTAVGCQSSWARIY